MKIQPTENRFKAKIISEYVALKQTQDTLLKKKKSSGHLSVRENWRQQQGVVPEKQLIINFET